MARTNGFKWSYFSNSFLHFSYSLHSSSNTLHPQNHDVDEFLSENFYGKIYITSLQFKDRLIKLLLDEIWTEESNKKSRTLTPSMV